MIPTGCFWVQCLDSCSGVFGTRSTKWTAVSLRCKWRLSPGISCGSHLASCWDIMRHLCLRTNGTRCIPVSHGAFRICSMVSYECSNDGPKMFPVDQPTKEDMYLRFRNAIENVNVIIVTWAWWWWTQHDPAVHFNLLPLCWLVFEAKAIGSSQNPGPQLSPTVPQRLQATYNDSSMGDLQVRPELGNVAFGSGLHGWGFSIETFAKILSAKSGMAPWPAPFVAPRWHWMWQKYAKVPR